MSTRIRALHAAHSTPVPLAKLQPAYFVLRREGHDWTAGASIIEVKATEREAMDLCADLQKRQRDAVFGIATLTSEIRTVIQTEIVRL